MDEGDLKPETTTEDSTPSPPPLEASSSSSSSLTPEQLAAKGIVPVKKEYLLPPPPQRSSNSNNNNNNNSDDRNAQVEDKNKNKNNESSSAVKVKKSKRQAKRERKEEQKSALHICPNVVKSGSADGCRYGSNCRYSHDLEAFEAQKPEDLEGKCPFLSIEGPCPYGLTCRFAGTHRTGVPSDGLNAQQKSSEVNGLKKETQRLLWKNKACFPKADAQLKLLGLLDKVKLKKPEVKEDDSEQMTANESPVPDEDNGCDVICDHVNKGESGLLGEVFVDEAVAMDDLQPLKKAKVAAEEEFCCGTGASPLEKGFGESCSLAEVERIPEIASLETDASLKLHPREKKLIDFRDKLYLAPLTTVGNLPFRRVCKVLGADVTCGEMAMCTNLLQGQASEWALLRRHSSEDVFGVQICGAYPDTVARTVEIIERECDIDFIDINMGCPIDLVCNKGAGSSLLTKPMRMKNIIHSASATVEKPITVKVRTAYFEGRNRIDSLISDMGHWGASAVTIHGRSRQQRYNKVADWDYIYLCAKKAPDTLQVIGNGDVSSYLDWNKHKSDCPKLSACMIARGAVIKPWLFTEIKEQRHWDISSSERLDILKDYVRFGLQHWGSDTKGVETTRHFLLEWLSYTYRYVPVGLLDIIPQKLNWRPPSYYGRDELETLMVSDSAADWIRISEILLGKVPDGFTFAPKHKSNAYDKAENG